MFLVNFLEKILLNSYYSLTNSYGFSIILLSLSVTVIMLPLFWLAEKLQEKDRKKKDLMRHELEEISEAENKQEKYFYTRELYKQHNYHPLNSLIGLIGLAIQLPFFIAAFNMLGSYEAFDGVVFLGISNLYAPDALFSFAGISINILPFVMTLINIVAGYFYSSEMDKNERLQLFGISFLFLVLLYNQPAALVFYWTINNVFSIGKTWILNKINKKKVIRKPFSIKPIIDTIFSENWISRTVTIGIIATIGLFVLLFITRDNPFGSDASFALKGAIAFIYLGNIYLGILLYKKNRDIFENQLSKLKTKEFLSVTSYTLFSIIAWAVVLLYTLFWILRIGPVDAGVADTMLRANKIIVFVGGVLLGIGFVYWGRGSIKDLIIKEFLLLKAQSKETKYLKSISILSFIYISTSIFLYLPVNIYQSSPEEFFNPLLSIMINIMPFYLFSILIFLGILILFKPLRYGISFLIISILIFMLINGVLFARDFGKFDSFVFVDNLNINGSILRNFLEFLFFAFSVLFSYFILKKYRLHYSIAVLLLNIALLTGIITNNSTYILETDNSVPERNNSLNDKSFEKHNIFEFSKNKENIVLFILDSFTGIYFSDIIKDHPEYKEIFGGFTFYPNTLSISVSTNSSISAVLKGWEYTPDKLNLKEKIDRETIITETYNEHYDAMLENNFDIDIDGTGYYRSWEYIKNNKNVNFGRKDLVERESDNLELHGLYHKLLPKIALFMFSPSVFKEKLYDKGNWGFEINDKNLDPEYLTFLKRRAFFFDLNKYSDAKNTQNKKYKLFYTYLPHYPFVTDENGFYVVNNSNMNKKDFQGQYAYSVAKYNIKLLVIWLNWLRENNVYNNTKIIIASDHGESSDKKLTERFPSIPNGFGRTNALLLVKDFNDLGNELDIDNRFMSNADIPSIIASSLDYPHLLTLDKDPRKKDTSNRTLPIYRATNMNRQNNSDENFEIIDSYKVTNNLFDPKNWEKQER